ncbi:MAG TPA: D-aminoacyl-tRNA deacylase [Gammaproteobacteria bacterium]|nr:D-aminoacyl-tRNA deacylase [Gammaproteobacteria bacterium]
MIGLLQRVSQASVSVAGDEIATIGPGLLVLIGIERDDTPQQADRLLSRLLGYRVFADAEGRMNRSLSDTGGGLLLVPQFTLVADTHKGTRPGFSRAAEPEQARSLFTYLCNAASQMHSASGYGQFGADMQVALVNDGPVTFWLHTH